MEVLTDGYIKTGWMDVSAPPDADLGSDENSFGFDGYLVQKWHQGREPYGRRCNIGDVIGCFLDLTDKIICEMKKHLQPDNILVAKLISRAGFSLNGELLLDFSGAEMAFDNVQVGDGFVPAFTLAPDQKVRFNFGQDANSLKFFTTCGLQEGYEPFCV